MPVFNHQDLALPNPALVYARERHFITSQEENILRPVVEKGTTKSCDLSAAMPNMTAPQRTYL
ncbi:MAG: hypothetical protein U5M23_09505 [Marinagarivorans sp.]|nr:hypothetical protein [Marinagarivorans sp.]